MAPLVLQGKLMQERDTQSVQTHMHQKYMYLIYPLITLSPLRFQNYSPAFKQKKIKAVEHALFLPRDSYSFVPSIFSLKFPVTRFIKIANILQSPLSVLGFVRISQKRLAMCSLSTFWFIIVRTARCYGAVSSDKSISRETYVRNHNPRRAQRLSVFHGKRDYSTPVYKCINT